MNTTSTGHVSTPQNAAKRQVATWYQSLLDIIAGPMPIEAKVAATLRALCDSSGAQAAFIVRAGIGAPVVESGCSASHSTVGSIEERVALTARLSHLWPHLEVPTDGVGPEIYPNPDGTMTLIQSLFASGTKAPSAYLIVDRCPEADAPLVCVFCLHLVSWLSSEEQRAAASRVRFVLDQYRTAAWNRAPIPCLIVDRHDHAMVANEAFLHHTLLKQPSLPGRRRSELVGPDDESKLFADPHIDDSGACALWFPHWKSR